MLGKEGETQTDVCVSKLEIYLRFVDTVTGGRPVASSWEFQMVHGAGSLTDGSVDLSGQFLKAPRQTVSCILQLYLLVCSKNFALKQHPILANKLPLALCC